MVFTRENKKARVQIAVKTTRGVGRCVGVRKKLADHSYCKTDGILCPTTMFCVERASVLRGTVYERVCVDCGTTSFIKTRRPVFAHVLNSAFFFSKKKTDFVHARARYVGTTCRRRSYSLIASCSESRSTYYNDMPFCQVLDSGQTADRIEQIGFSYYTCI